MKNFYSRTLSARALFVSFLLLISINVFGAGWAPTDAGLIVDLKPGDSIMISVMVGDKEYFLCDYPSYTSNSPFKYSADNRIKLIPQDDGVITPSAASVWHIDTALTRIIDGKDFALGGISYTMRGYYGNTLTTTGNDYSFLGNLTKQGASDYNSNYLCDVAFVVPTVRSTIDLDPNHTLDPDGTLGRIIPFDGKTGVGFAGHVYREVFMFHKSRINGPTNYVNMLLVTFNTSNQAKKWNNNSVTIQPGYAYYAAIEDKHKPTTRTLFRLYVLGRHPFNTCPDSYFFAHDEQDYIGYRNNANDKKASYRTPTKIYTTDHHHCMEHAGDGIYKTDGIQIPESDSAYYYVGYKNKYCNASDTIKLNHRGAVSQFKRIDSLRVIALANEATAYRPCANAYGRMVVDTMSTKQNLGVAFEPAGYFLRTSTGVNVRMVPNEDGTVWTSEEVWRISPSYDNIFIKAALFTGPDFREGDPGADIKGWSAMVPGTSIHVKDSAPSVSVLGKVGWGRIYINNPATNGGLELVLVDTARHVHYDNNNFLGAQIPDQYPEIGNSKIKVQEARLKEGFTFLGWTKEGFPNDTIHAGDSILLDPGTTILHAQAKFTGTYNVAFSFVHSDGKRYFLNHPGTDVPRFARARHYEDWTNTWQGMANAKNDDPNYVSTFKMIGHENTCVECFDGEYVLDPRRETLHGDQDSLTFYEHFSPEDEEYLGLYYTEPNTIVANNTWAGLFSSTQGWPNYLRPSVDSTKIKSDYYLHRVNGVITRDERSNSDSSYVKFNAADNQFDGEKFEVDGTTFQISAVVVADGHYVIIPDTTTAWTDTITFDYHEEATSQEVWSKLIGKQLMACMMVGKDTVYFHPKVGKTVTTADALSSIFSDYQLTQTFGYIHDSRVELPIANQASLEETDDDFSRRVVSADSSPINVQYQSHYVDIYDTIRIRLNPRPTSMIKDYYGRWKRGAAGLTVDKNGTRYRDIIVRTKTYHSGPDTTKLKLMPELDYYTFGPLSGQSRQLDFTLVKETFHWLFDAQNNPIKKVISVSDTITNQLLLSPTYCSLRSGATLRIAPDSTRNNYVTIVTKMENTEITNYDTLTISTTMNVGGVNYPVSARVPLMQAALTETELIWSVVDNNDKNKPRYFILAGSGGLIFREYDLSSKTLSQKSTKEVLIIGSANSENNNTRYLTPWKFEYPNKTEHPDQITLKTEYGVNRFFNISGSPAVPGVHNSESSILTFAYAHVYTNSNANYEEQVRLKYGPNQWLKFSVTNGIPSLSLQSDSATATVFSWSYLLKEYSLQNNGWPSNTRTETYGYNTDRTASIQTRYKAYWEYSMLLNNTSTYLCKTECTTTADLIDPNKEWKTSFDIRLIRDSRFAEGASGLTFTYVDSASVSSKVKATTKTSPTNIRYPAGTGPYVDIVDTLEFTLSLQPHAPEYRFKSNWSKFTSVEDAHIKVPLIRKTYHEATYDSVMCRVANDDYNHVFPAAGINSTHTFTLGVERHQGSHILDVDNLSVKNNPPTVTSLTEFMDLSNLDLAEIRLIDEYGNAPTWCEISDTTANTITVKCTANGIRAPRVAYLYLAFIVNNNAGVMRYVNYQLTVTQPSLFEYANNQHLVHSKGASGDPLVRGMQQVHENKRILYYYPDQNVELPIRERGFYGWWRWYREGEDENGVDVGDSDVPDSLWRRPPLNIGRYNIPYRTIGDSVKVPNPKYGGNPGEPDSIKQLITMGRYTVFHYVAKDYSGKYKVNGVDVQDNAKSDPPAKSPQVVPPIKKKVLTYVADISNYYDNLPLQMSNVNQIDTVKLEKMLAITEPTLSLREIFELHPWTEMADTLEKYKVSKDGPFENEKYMEDHVVMAPIGNRLLLSTNQRYNYENMKQTGYEHSESLLGYYMKDDNWNAVGWDSLRRDTMIWCGGWDAPCGWYTYDPMNKTYDTCSYEVTVGDDFLNVPAKQGISAEHEFDTVYYCLRSRSMKTLQAGTPGDPDDPVAGDYWFNICRYMIIYHSAKNQYGPWTEETNGAGFFISNDEIEQNYEVLERLNFDYNQPSSDYEVYPHPLPWADASYGYSYPKTPALPDNRYHNDFAPNFAGPGEYGIVNKIPYTKYWHPLEQHGGADKGYMIYCDGMSSAGQVAALSLKTQLCEGQKMYFSGYVANASNQKIKDGKPSCPNFTFSVQGSDNGTDWTDITTYMTGDLQPSPKWYQIFFPIHQKGNYSHFRVRIFNVASDFDGNDFAIDDMCIFATKPPLVAYQANTSCVKEGENDSITQVVLRVDYQGFIDTTYNNDSVYYTVEKMTMDSVYSFVPMEDGYLSEQHSGDTVYGAIKMPPHTYVPQHPEDSVFENMNALVDTFELSNYAFRKGYIYENIDGATRPVLYVLHKAKMTADNRYKVRMSLSFHDLMSSICAMTSNLKVTNKMMLELNGEEQPDKELDGVCANSIYDIGLRVKGSLFIDSVAPIDLNGSCMNDWLLYGDTARESSKKRYGYYYSDIVKVVKDILRAVPSSGTNTNQYAASLAAVSKNQMQKIWTEGTGVRLDTTAHPYDILVDMVNKGFLTLYQAKTTTSVTAGDSLQYVVFPIVGTGFDKSQNENVEVCPTPLFIKLKPKPHSGDVPMSIGGLKRDSTQANLPIVILTDSISATSNLVIPIDSFMSSVAIYYVDLLSTDDPNFHDGYHLLSYDPDKVYNLNGDNSSYYKKGDNLILSPASSNNYHMRPGYSYTYGIIMQTLTGNLEKDGCPVGTVPFTVSLVPNQLQWAPQNAGNANWNDPANWIGVDQKGNPLPSEARFAPLPSSSIIIPDMLAEGMPYPVMASSISSKDSVKQMGFSYNACDNIRFLPGAAIGQQQNLTYNNAIVDMRLPNEQWTLRAAPVTGMLSGDVFLANADLNGDSSPWEAGEFDASGRNHKTGNASFWLSVYNRATSYVGNGNVESEDRTAEAEWSKVTNGLTLPLQPATGWAVYTRTAEGVTNADVRLPKTDDVYYYYTRSGDKDYTKYESGLQAKRKDAAGSAAAGKLAYSGTSYTLTNAVASEYFVFGNPTMGYIDIWGFIYDNRELLNEEISYFNAGSYYTPESKASALATTDTIINQQRYLPPTQAIVLKAKSSCTSLSLTLNTNRIVTNPGQVTKNYAPARRNIAARSKGIMTVTAVNPADASCASRLLVGQGYHDEVLEGEDAMLTTINVEKPSSTSPMTPFNIYAAKDGYGLSIDLRDEVLNIPVSFCISELPFEPISYLWFTGVNNIEGSLMLYDALLDTERPIIDGICLNIETPESSHEKRYYIRRRGFNPDDPSDPIATDIDYSGAGDNEEQAIKIIHHGQVYVLRGGHVYSIFGQKVR